MTKKTILDLMKMKKNAPIAMLTAYDYQMAAMLDETGVDMLLVGDSLGNVIYGLDSTLPVSIEDMIRHTQSVARAAKQALVVGDMPFGSYQTSMATAVKNAVRLLAEGGAQAVKLEGGAHMGPTIKRLVEVGIPVMGHVGLTPQSVHQLGGYRIQGKTNLEAKKIFDDARAVEKAGAFSVVLECVDPELAATITQELSIPTIGIGSGSKCDGQVLVVNDLLGLTVSSVPKFVEPTANLRPIITEAAKKYIQRVKQPS